MNYNLHIEGEIGYWECSGRYICARIAEMKDKHIDCYISSPGGSVPDALQIYQAFKEHGDVTVYFFGMPASAATILAMGAKEIKMSKNALLLIHKCSTWNDVNWRMNADEIEAAIKQLQDNKDLADKIDDIQASIYALRAGGDKDTFVQKMKDALWLTAAECKELGLVDDIIEEGEPAKMTAAMMQRFVALGYPMPKNVVQREEPRKGFREHVTDILTDLGILKAKKTELTNNNQMETNKQKFLLLAAAIGIEAITAKEDGTFSFTAEQMEKMEQALKAVNDDLAAAKASVSEKETTIAGHVATIAERDQKITELNTQIEALKKGDGDDTHHIEGDTHEGDKPDASVTAEMNEFLKNID